ncbi:PRC-barrel domain-containing protein [Microtetraspora malaysiensis]|uniref:PRC-barrel domain-containing protein n=1 Tax=Microtetraspora malaysiensis TaxID=161358 RepID=UPI000831D27C|nr:PRC-barrel domain-containing protein [Microtetraspora malaysiensis]
MITQEQIPRVLDIPVQGTGGQRLGEVKHVFLDDDTGQPEWLCVKTGLFGSHETFVPIRNADLVEDHVEVPYDKERVKGAPHVDVDAGGHLSVEQERELYRYYDMSWEQANEPGTGWAHTAGQQERERMAGGFRDETATRPEGTIRPESTTRPEGTIRPGETTGGPVTGPQETRRPGESFQPGERASIQPEQRTREPFRVRLRRYLRPGESRGERPDAKRDDFGDTGQSGRPF